MLNRKLSTYLVPLTLLLLFVAGCTSSTSTLPAAVRQQVGQGPSHGSEAVDFSPLRAEYGARQDFYALCEKDRPLRDWDRLRQQGQWEDILVSTTSWLSACPVDIDAHCVTAMALSKLGREVDAQHHMRWCRGLVQSVLDSGDGRSADTAFVVVSVFEEYAVLRVLGLRFKRQALMKGDIDAITVEKEGSTSIVYFNPKAHFQRLRRQFGVSP